MKKVTLIALMVTMFLAGGLMFAECSADTPEEIAPEIVTEEPEIALEVEPAEEPEEIAEEIVEEEIAEEPEEITPEEIIAEDTGLQVDKVKLVDAYNNWLFYEVFADGDIYAVTIKGDNVDVCAILN